MKTLTRLCLRKNELLRRMTNLNELARAENRDLTESEALDFRLGKEQVEGLNSAIFELEHELFTPGPVSVEGEPKKRNWLDEMDSALGLWPHNIAAI
jgi:hypothetical protein